MAAAVISFSASSQRLASLQGFPLVTGTSGSHQRVKPDSFLAMQIIIPPNDIVGSFTCLVRPSFEQLFRNLAQSRTLAALRDALLPKLISGEMRVKDAERILKEQGL